MSVVLPAPVGPTMAMVFSGFGRKRDVVNALLGVGKTEIDVAELHGAGDIRQFAGITRFFPFLDGIFQHEEIFKLGSGFENLRHELAHLV